MNISDTTPNRDGLDSVRRNIRRWAEGDWAAILNSTACQIASVRGEPRRRFRWEETLHIIASVTSPENALGWAYHAQHGTGPRSWIDDPAHLRRLAIQFRIPWDLHGC